MSNVSNKFLSRLFRRIDGVVWDLTSNKLGLKTAHGILTLVVNPGETGNNTSTASEDTYSVSMNPFDSFGFALPAFAQNTPLNQIEIGDLIVGDTKALGWVIGKTERSLRLLDQSGMTKNYTPVKVQVLNQDGAMVVKSLTGLFGDQGAQGFGGALLPLLLAGDNLGGEGGLEDLLPMLLLTQQTAGSNNPNAVASVLPTILMMKAIGKKGGSGNMSDLLLPMMLSGGLGGGAGSMNPMMMLALMGEGGGGLGGLGNVPTQIIGQQVPTLVPSNTYPSVPALQRTR